MRPGDDAVATFVRIDDATPLAPELRLRYRWRAGEPKFATNAFFFEEGTGERYAGARYGEFRVGPDGESILTGLRDAARGRSARRREVRHLTPGTRPPRAPAARRRPARAARGRRARRAALSFGLTSTTSAPARCACAGSAAAG